ncbi:MAG: chemotaxis protein CheW, partial [Deltaproteobacteria bacterium]|nr:chemotaxis protein CheW [Deltaproteobacteria bacterium]
KGGNVVIEIEDDGRGLDRDKILQKAVTQGLVSEKASTSDTELFNIIFHPGFSTAEKVTDISGRGVGMDVVKKSIEELRGKVEIQSRPGHGSTFLMRLPLTLAIIDGIIVKVGEERYIIPTLNVKEFLRPDREACSTLLDKGEMIKVRERLLPLTRLYELFTVSPENTRPWEALVVVVENGEEERCLMVDDLVGKQEVVIKSLGETFEDIKGTSGGTILGDGRVGLILDVNGLFAVAKGNGSGNSTPADLETASMGLEPGERVGPSNLN